MTKLTYFQLQEENSKKYKILNKVENTLFLSPPGTNVILTKGKNFKEESKMCYKKEIQKRDIDWTKLENIIHGNWDTASTNTHEIYGSVSDIIRNNGELVRTQELTERNIFFEKTLEMLNNLTLMRPETFTVKPEEEKTAQDHIEDMKKMDNVVCFD